MPPPGSSGQDKDANSGRRAVLKPRAVAVDVEGDAAEIVEKRERKLAELRRRALAALNVGLPPSRDEVDEAAPALASASRGSSLAKCTCLRRSGQCTCNEDRAWLQSKRKEVSTYRPPHARQASGGQSSSSREVATEQPRIPDGEDDAGTPCTCLRRSGRCTCKQDAAWLKLKRRLVIPYVPPYVKERDVDMRRTKARRIEAEATEADSKPIPPGAAADNVSERGSAASSGRWLAAARCHFHWLEESGESRFNPLQMDGQIVLADTDGLVAECTDHPLSMKGVKGLPAIQSGRYQFEVELLRDSSMMLGWSGAMTLPGVLDFQGYAYSSSGCKWHGRERSPYATPYGKAGDVVGALIDWIEPETASGTSSIQIGFCLNGKSLGPAFKVAANLGDATKGLPVPLQPHVCQLPEGEMLKVRLRGSKAAFPLKYPVEGHQPLSALSDGDFCPFSEAIEAATSERVIMSLTSEHLQSFKLPENHIAELYDFTSDASAETLTSSVACFLGLKRNLGVLHVCITEADSSTAIVACRRPEHAEKLIEATQADGFFGVVDCTETEKKREKLLHFEARPLSAATARSKQFLHARRGEEYKAQSNCDADPA